tara:strand:+ start:611 stop:1303 length:693 start_codon:yes stop_codon:yes gene_type:complete
MVIKCIVQARIASKRLPGKVLKKIRNKEILLHIVEKLKRSKDIKKTIVATSTSKSDDKIEFFCKKKKLNYFRGSLQNVYKRYSDLLTNEKCDFFIRVCADSPLVNEKIIKKLIFFLKHYKNKYHIYTNVFPRSFPKGISIEIISRKIFIENIKNIKKKKFKEHVTKYFYANPKKFKIFNLKFKKNYKNINLSVDNANDFKLINYLYNIKNFNKLTLEQVINKYRLLNEKN